MEFIPLIVLAICLYVLIGLGLCLLWIDDVLEKWEGGNAGKDSFNYVLRCAFLWPYLLLKKDAR